MKSSSAKTQPAFNVLRKSGMLFLTAAVAGMMMPAMALADTGNAASGSGTYGAQPSKEIGGTAPSAANGDTAYNLEQRSSTYVVGGAGGNGTASCDYLDVLGVDNIGMFGYNWGTKINENPNAFAWNDLLTDVNNAGNAAQQGTDNASSSLGLGYCKAAWSGTMTYASVYKYRPQILATSNQGVSTYQKIVDYIHTADGNDDYNPTIVTMAKSNGQIGLTALSDTLWDEAKAVENLADYKSSKVSTRYGDPTDIAQNFEAFTKATQWYILSKHEKQGTLKKVAYVSGYDTSGNLTLETTDPTSEGDIWSRTLEGFEQITENVANNLPDSAKKSEQKGAMTYTTTSFDVLKDADVVFWAADLGTSTGTGYSGTSNNKTLAEFKAAMEAAGCSGKVVDLGYSDTSKLGVPHQGFGMVRNFIEYASYLYPEDVKLSYMLKYYWTQFCHIKEQYVDAVMANQDKNKLLPTDDADTDLDTSGYTVDYMNNIFDQGETYYLANYKDENSYCSNYRLQANGTIEENTYTFGTYKTSSNGSADNNTSAKTAAKKANTLKVGKTKVKVKKGKTAKVAVKKAQGTVTVTCSKKKIAKVTYKKKTGKIVIKGKKKGKVKITVKAAGNSSYNAGTKTITVTVK